MSVFDLGDLSAFRTADREYERRMWDLEDERMADDVQHGNDFETNDEGELCI